MSRTLTILFYSLMALLLVLVLAINPEKHLTFAYILFVLNVIVVALPVLNFFKTRRKSILIQLTVALLSLVVSGYELHVAEYKDDLPKLKYELSN